MILDCENKETVFNSLASIFKCSEEDLVNVLRSRNVPEYYLENGKYINIPMEYYLFDHVKQIIGPPEIITTVCWFHSTRTTQNNIYKEGILPLANSLARVWEMLIENAPSSEIGSRLRPLKDGGVMNSTYNAKISKAVEAGPFATLVKDLIFNLENLPFHDYTEMPEIVEDILKSIPTEEDIDLRSHYERVLVPKIIKFSAPACGVGLVATALNYASDCSWGVPAGGWTNACFDGEGTVINNEQILKVETCKP